MRIVIIAGEAQPFCGTGRVARFVPFLSSGLVERGHSVTIFLPLHRGLREHFTEVQEMAPLELRMHDGRESARLWQASNSLSGMDVFAIGGDRYFDRPGFYGEAGVHYADSVRRFSFFCRAALGALGEMETAPDILHAQDWPAALVPIYLRAPFLGRDSAQRAVAALAQAASVLTVHEPMDEGNFPSPEFSAAGVSREAVDPPTIEVGGSVSLLREGVRYADHVVLGTGPSDVATDEPSDLLIDCSAKLSRISSGVDEKLDGPRADPYLAAAFDAENRKGKRRCKADLVLETNLDPALDAPIAVVFSPLAPGQGLDLLLATLPELTRRDLRVVLMGEGDTRIAENLREAARTSAGRFVFCESGNEALRHKLYAGADFVLVLSEDDSRSDVALVAQTYGALPVVRNRGSLVDFAATSGSVESAGTGLWIPEPAPISLLETVDQALRLFADAGAWSRWQRRAMECAVSEPGTVEAYDRLYASLGRDGPTAPEVDRAKSG